MITFNNLRFTNDLQSLLIDVQADSELPEDVSDVLITKIYLEYYKNRTATLTPSDKKVQVWPAGGSGSLAHVDISVPVTILEDENIGTEEFRNGLFYVYVLFDYTEGTTTYHDGKAIGAVLDWNAVYQKGMSSVAKLVKKCEANSCEPPVFFEQFVIAWHAFILSMNAKDFDMVDRLWGRLLSVSSGMVVSGSPCNCG